MKNIIGNSCMANMLRENYFYRWTVIFRVIYAIYVSYIYKKMLILHTLQIKKKYF